MDKNVIRVSVLRRGKTAKLYRLRFYTENSPRLKIGGYSIPVYSSDIMMMLIGNRCHDRADLLSVQKADYGKLVMTFVRKHWWWSILLDHQSVVLIPHEFAVMREISE